MDTTPQQWVALLIEQGAALRKTGVTRVEIAGCVADLAPIEDSVNEQVVKDLLERIQELEPDDDGDDPLARVPLPEGWGS